jgi:hypothetical protein
MHAFIKFEPELNLNNPYIPIEEEIIGMLDGGGDVADKGPIEEVDVQIIDVVVDRV